MDMKTNPEYTGIEEKIRNVKIDPATTHCEKHVPCEQCIRETIDVVQKVDLAIFRVECERIAAQERQAGRQEVCDQLVTVAMWMGTAGYEEFADKLAMIAKDFTPKKGEDVE